MQTVTKTVQNASLAGPAYVQYDIDISTFYIIPVNIKDFHGRAILLREEKVKCEKGVKGSLAHSLTTLD